MNPAWARALLARDLLAQNPHALRGLRLRARPGPVRDRYLASLTAALPPIIPISPNTSDEALFGGLDVTASLAAGRRIQARGLIPETPATLLLKMAERCPAELALRLAQILDNRSDLTLILLDEGASPEESAPPALIDRLAFHAALEDLSIHDAEDLPPIPLTSETKTKADTQTITDLTTLAIRFGITSFRAPMLATHAAKAMAAQDNRTQIDPSDTQAAAELVLAHRALQMPEPEPEPEAPEQPESEAEQTEGKNQETAPEDMAVDATKAAIPKDLLAALIVGHPPSSTRGTSALGALKTTPKRGRPLPPRQGRPDGRARIDLIATLRSAVPWQKLRTKPTRSKVAIRGSDIHLKRSQNRSDRLVTFVVDASGSAAMNRLSEAKGALEMLLGEAYAKRDHVALVAYAKTKAETLLPPTRSLVQTKRRLADLPGGGGTPLAMGLREALATTLQAQGRGFAPTLAFLADGRTNIDLSGEPNRPQALEDAIKTAQGIATLNIPAILIDMSRRPSDQLREVANALNATYFPLPFADAKSLNTAVKVGLEARP